MPAHCSVLGCSNRGTKNSNFRFFRIPSEIRFKYRIDLNELSIKRRQAWLDALHRDFSNHKISNARICSRHFIQDTFQDYILANQILGYPAPLTAQSHADWVPSVDMGYNNSGKNINGSPSHQPADIEGVNNSDCNISSKTAYISNISIKKSPHYDNEFEEDHPDLVSPSDIGCTSFKKSLQNYNPDELEQEDQPDLVYSSDISCISNIGIKRSTSIDQFHD